MVYRTVDSLQNWKIGSTGGNVYITIRSLLAREQFRQQPTADPMAQPMPTGKPAVKSVDPGMNDDEDDEAMLSPDDIGQQEQEEQMRQEQSQNEGEFPMHEVNADPQRYPVDQAKQLHSFLKNAAGGTGTFTTANKESHEMAKTLARSGHLQHHGSRLGGAGGGLRHVWSLTPKGMAAIGQAPAPKRPGMGGQQRPGGGQQQRPGGMGQRPQMQQRPGSGSFGNNLTRR
jgi:hypothetical protein